jgi:integrase
MDAKLWTVPPKRMKAGEEHRVPLSTAAIAVVQQMPRDSASAFPGRTHDTVLSDMSLTAVLRRMGRGDITIHGFRLTVRDWCAEAAGNSFPREVCVHALAHSLPNRVEAAYRRGNLLEKRTGFIRIDIKHLPRMPDQASRRYRFGAADLSAHSE